MATLLTLALGYSCLYACTNSPVVRSYSVEQSVELKTFRPVSDTSEIISIPDYAKAHAKTRFQSQFGFDPGVQPYRLEGEPVSLPGEEADPVDSFELTSFKPLRSAVTALKIGRETQPYTEIDATFSGQMSFNTGFDSGGQQFGVGIVPRFSVWREDAFEGIRVGGELRFGQDFDQRGKGAAEGGWYIFIGTDDEALTLNGASGGEIALRDQMTVGDLQAGLLIGGARRQVIVGLTRRTVEYTDQNMSLSHEEDFAGVSFVRQF